MDRTSIEKEINIIIAGKMKIESFIFRGDTVSPLKSLPATDMIYETLVEDERENTSLTCVIYNHYKVHYLK